MDPDPLMRSTDQDPDPAADQDPQKKYKTPDSYCFVTSLSVFIIEKWFKCTGTLKKK